MKVETSNTYHVQLQPHQQRVIDKLYGADAPRGLLAYHSLGSGKTLTALKALERGLSNKNSRGIFVAPASLTKNVEKEREKHGVKINGNLDIYSYEKAAKAADLLAKQPYDIAVFDEAQKLRNRTSSTNRLKNSIIDPAKKLLFLSGTPAYNDPSNMLSLVDLIDHEQRLPISKLDFEQRYVDVDRNKLRNTAGLKKVLNRYVDKYQTPSNSADFPREIHRKVIVEMSPNQEVLYRKLNDELPAYLKHKIQNKELLDVTDVAALNNFSSGIRQASDSVNRHFPDVSPYDSTKLRTAANHMLSASKKIPGFRGVAYSNYLGAGLDPYEKILKKKGLQPLVFTGELSAKAKKGLVDKYNEPSKDPRVLLLSSSGGEGIDLKNTRLLQVLEPHFNRSKIKQVEGRGARYKSHDSLPEKDRDIYIEEYFSRLPKTKLQKLFKAKADTSIDEYLDFLANKKQDLADQMDRLID